MALVAKQKAIEDFDTHFIPIAQTLEATFRVAGEVELADRIRPTIRRLTRPGEDDGSPPSEESPSEESAESSEASPAPAVSAEVSAEESTSVETSASSTA